MARKEETRKRVLSRKRIVTIKAIQWHTAYFEKVQKVERGTRAEGSSKEEEDSQAVCISARSTDGKTIALLLSLVHER